MRKQDTTLIGTRLGRLIVLAVDPNCTYRGETLWLCQCDCGKIKSVRKTNLLRNTRSCGCLHIEMTVARQLKHGMSKSPEYTIWASLKNRCQSPTDLDYAHYGGRGITVCERWQSFENFFADMGSRPSIKHSIDRVDVNGPYCPENCRWATSRQQGRNKRTSVRLTHEGETMTMVEWAERFGLSYLALKQRVKNGWSVERALLTPVRVNERTPMDVNHD